MLEIKWFFREWKEATKEQAERLYKHFCNGAINIKCKDKQKYFNDNYIRGGHVLCNGTIETTEEQKERVFQHYKNILIKETRDTSGNKNLRFCVIEYLCNFPQIDPYKMAASIVKDGITILFDDSSISKIQNDIKRKKLNKMLLV